MLALGPGVGTFELAELVHMASSPLEQHLLLLEGVSEAEVAYALGFTWAFLNLLKMSGRGCWVGWEEASTEPGIWVGGCPCLHPC